MKRRIKTLCVVAAIAIVATVIIGLLIISPWTIIRSTAFSFIILAEIIFFAGLLALEMFAQRTEQVFSRAGMVSILSLYAIFAIAISIFYIVYPAFKTSRLWVLQILLLAVASILAVITMSAGKRVLESDKKTVEATSVLQAYIGRLNDLALNDRASEYKETINKLADELRYTDTSIIVSVDNAIGDSISSLEVLFSKTEIDIEKIDNEFGKLNSLIKKRKLSVASAQRGKF